MYCAGCAGCACACACAFSAGFGARVGFVGRKLRVQRSEANACASASFSTVSCAVIYYDSRTHTHTLTQRICTDPGNTVHIGLLSIIDLYV